VQYSASRGQSNLLFSSGRRRFRNLKASYCAMGLVPRQHGNAHRLPHNTLIYECKEHVVKFLQNFAEANAILLPGRIPGYKRDDVQLLPSSMMKVFLLRPV